MVRSILALGVFVAFAAPAMAEEYYIVHGQDRHCSVVERIPEGHLRVGPSSFSTRGEAERQLSFVCRDKGYYRDEVRDEHRENR